MTAGRGIDLKRCNAVGYRQLVFSSGRQKTSIARRIRRFDTDHRMIFIIGKVWHYTRFFDPRIPHDCTCAVLSCDLDLALPLWVNQFYQRCRTLINTVDFLLHCNWLATGITALKLLYLVKIAL